MTFQAFAKVCKSGMAVLSYAGLATIICGLPATALAQDDALEEIVVQGYRSSLKAALGIKRDEAGVVDSIVAQDIAAFPDLNLAESIQRIPGVSISRVNGEGRQITVRGLSGDYNRIRINGMEAMNTTGSADSSGGANRGRGFDFNTFASELFNGITVRKTSSADVEEGAIGATLDLDTSRPFDYDDGTTIATSVQGGYNDLSDEINPRFAALLSHSNADKTFGALFSVAYSTRSILEEGFSTVRWQDGNFRSVDGNTCPGVPADPGCTSIDTNSLTYHPRIPRYGRLTHEQDRLGVTGSLQFAPTDSTEITFDAMYSKFEATRVEEYLEVFFRSQEGRIDVSNFTIDPVRNIMDSGTYTISPIGNGTHPVRSEARFDELNTDFTQFTLNLEHDFSDRLRMNAFAGTSTSDHDVPKQTTILYDAINTVTGYMYDFRGNPNAPAIDFGDLDVNDASQFAFTEFRDRPYNVENSFSTFAADLAFDLNDNITLKGGVSWKQFEFDTVEYRRENTAGSLVCGYYDCDTDNDGTNDIPGAPITPDMLSNLSGFGSGLGAPAGIDTSWVSPNIAAAAALIDVYSIPGAPQVGNIRNVEEEDIGFWAQLDFIGELGNVGVRGNLGVRQVETTTTSTGVLSGATAVVERSYDDTLPSLNLAFDLSDSFVARVAVAEVMARPSLGNLTPGGSLDSFNGPPFSYNSGNPGLDPYRATNYDLSLEWYFAEDALLSFGYFSKDVDSFFTSGATVIMPYSQTGLDISVAPSSSPLRVALDAGQDPNVEVSQVQNGGNATVDGYEIIYQQPFTFLPGIWQNFGFTGNYTRVNSDEILGFSENAFNATVYFENDRFSARVSTAYRDAYQTNRPNGAGRDERGYSDTTNIDLAMAYKLNDTIDLTFEAINLTDEFEQQVFDAGDLVNVYHHTGTEYIFGIRWSPK
ncbi:MAG: TonB-dependent receptor [Gammaproteobacteria bacterium]|nr:TonB-dependent receptor [Gammaproteobacteria bacterium]MDH5239255.1 TonB-dependent receptor [Gammaproteobacteria bacterium]MDH5259991.1 TonB-dependent receptor [Gammaproteobacteria bacterium]MDH5620480.1 TonB-dependent receptor [Gammaproteobacteria bacterium]